MNEKKYSQITENLGYSPSGENLLLKMKLQKNKQQKWIKI